MISWICQQAEIELPVRKVRTVSLAKARRWFSGYAYYYSGRISLRINESSPWPYRETDKYGFKLDLSDATDALIFLTAHEIGHLAVAAQKGVQRERWIDAQAVKVQLRFREQRESLLAAWNKPIERVAACKAATVDPRAGLLEKIARWRRKHNLAATKLDKYRRQLARLEKKMRAAE